MSTTDKGLPPFIKTWRRFYWLVIAWLALLIMAFYLFTQYFR